MNILEMDRGNSALKWRALTDARVVSSGVCAADSDFSVLADELVRYKPDRVRMVNVAGSEVESALVAECRKCWDVSVAVARSGTEVNGVRNGYTNPSELGTDRWSALVAAHVAYPGRALCVVDCGSAITVDFVEKSGQHLGGYIAPGQAMMYRALADGTARLGDASPRPDGVVDVRPGHTTDEAVSRGMRLMITGLVRSSADLFATDAAMVCTGGDAATILSCVEGDARARIYHHAGLVLDGLQYLVP